MIFHFCLYSMVWPFFCTILCLSLWTPFLSPWWYFTLISESVCSLLPISSGIQVSFLQTKLYSNCKFHLSWYFFAKVLHFENFFLLWLPTVLIFSLMKKWSQCSDKLIATHFQASFESIVTKSLYLIKLS